MEPNSVTCRPIPPLELCGLPCLGVTRTRHHRRSGSCRRDTAARAASASLAAATRGEPPAFAPRWPPLTPFSQPAAQKPGPAHVRLTIPQSDTGCPRTAPSATRNLPRMPPLWPAIGVGGTTVLACALGAWLPCRPRARRAAPRAIGEGCPASPARPCGSWERARGSPMPGRLAGVSGTRPGPGARGAMPAKSRAFAQQGRSAGKVYIRRPGEPAAWAQTTRPVQGRRRRLPAAPTCP